MAIRIVDTTLRDGEQMPGLALGTQEKLRIAAVLDKLGVYQIEAGIPSMGGEEIRAIRKMIEMQRTCLVSTWNRLNLFDVDASMQLHPDIIHISVPSSDVQIIDKLGRNKAWVLEKAVSVVRQTVKSGFRVTVGLEDASRADISFLSQLTCAVTDAGAERLRYADTVGIASRRQIYKDLRALTKQSHIDWEVHCHNDLGMAVTNSLAAVKAGACFVNTTLGGIGERAGNCNWQQFLYAAKSCLGIPVEASEIEHQELLRSIAGLFRGRLHLV